MEERSYTLPDFSGVTVQALIDDGALVACALGVRGGRHDHRQGRHCRRLFEPPEYASSRATTGCDPGSSGPRGGQSAADYTNKSPYYGIGCSVIGGSAPHRSAGSHPTALSAWWRWLQVRVCVCKVYKVRPCSAAGIRRGARWRSRLVSNHRCLSRAQRDPGGAVGARGDQPSQDGCFINVVGP